jgi:hypothetical protein
MYYAAKMGIRERATDLLKNLHKTVALIGPLSLLVQDRVETPSGDQFHHYERTPVMQCADVEYRRYSWVLQLGNDPYMVTKSTYGVCVRERNPARHFACHLPTERVVAHPAYHSHAPTRNLT